ncbi:hypothetical protein ACFPOB_20065 [Bosea eneae]|uniref:Uncharacterized protein n=1 Tax=Bosea eneae TaxID=151454 RepID=A0ABW0IUE7_9HYPH
MLKQDALQVAIGGAQRKAGQNNRRRGAAPSHEAHDGSIALENRA